MELSNKRIAAIDLGTNSFHLVIVQLKDIEQITSFDEIEAKGSFEVLYRQREVVRINVGESLETNVLTKEGIERAVKVLKDFKSKIDEYKAITYAVATSAIREAENKEEFLNYVRNSLGIDIKVISGYEEAKLIYLGVLQGLNVYSKQILLIDIGGGSTEILVGKRGKALYAASFKLGAVRLAYKFFDGGKIFSKERKYECEKYIQETIADNLMPVNLLGFEQVIGTSGEIQSIARLLFISEQEPKGYKTFHGVDFSYQEFERVSRKIFEAETLNQLKSIKTLDDRRAEIIVPGTLILKVLFEKLNIDKITVSAFALREGIIIDAIEKLYRDDFAFEWIDIEKKKIRDLRLKSVIELAQSYNADLTHSNQVKKIALKLFDELKSFHNLDSNARELLEYASILHDIGYHISPKKHHINSYFIIKNSNLVGFTEKEIDLISNIARYHRKSLPKDKHKNFQKLNPEEKRLVEILSATLRLSDGLEKTHNALIRDIKIIANGGENSITLLLRYLTHPPESELWAAEKRKRVLEDLLNFKIELRLEKISYLS